MVYDVADHSFPPFGRRVVLTVVAVLPYDERVVEVSDGGELCDQVHSEAFIAFVPVELDLRFLEHGVRFRLWVED